MVSLSCDGAVPQHKRRSFHRVFFIHQAAVALRMMLLFDVPQLKTYRLLHKTASLVDGFNLLVKELGYMTTHSSDFNGFDPNVLPLDRTIDPDTIDRNALTLFNQWEPAL